MEKSFHTVEYGEGSGQSQPPSGFVCQEALLQTVVRLCLMFGNKQFPGRVCGSNSNKKERTIDTQCR